MSVSSNAPAQPTLPRRASVETLAGLRCALVGETDSTFACPICSRVLRLPQLTDCCGNHFCTSCLSRWLQVSSSCPLCRQVGFKSIRDKKIERAVQDMEVGVSITLLFSPENNLQFRDSCSAQKFIYKHATALLQQTKEVYYCNSCTFQQ